MRGSLTLTTSARCATCWPCLLYTSYVLKGHGHDVHDGRTMTWQAGDVMLVENGCVHQHFNDDENKDCILLVFKAKPLFLFMHLLFQKMVEWPTDKLPPGHEDFKPPSDI